MPRSPRRSFCPPIVAAGVAAAIAACATQDAVVGPAPRTDAGQFWALTLDHHAITLSTVPPHDSIRLTAIPRDAAGHPLGGFPAATFQSLDTTRVLVDSDGLVHALQVGVQVLVVATLKSGALTVADTAAINVTAVASPPTLTVLSIHPAPGDSAEAPIDQTGSLPTYAFDSSGAPIDGLAVYYTATDDKTARIDRYAGAITGVYPGHVLFTATATAYGVTKSDTARFVIGWPVFAFVNITPQTTRAGKSVNGFVPSYMIVGTGAQVVFGNETFNLTDVTFDNPAAVDSSALYCYFAQFGFPWLCGTGNIEPFALDTTIVGSDLRARAFPLPGTYNYHSTLFGTTGVIVVVDWHTL